MIATSLQDDLLRIPGVEGAEVDGSQDAPAGLRIRIAEGADQQAVGGAIRRVLSSHGLGTDTRLPGEPTVRDELQDDPGTVALLTSEADEPGLVQEAPEDSEDAEDDSEDPEDLGRAIIDLTDDHRETSGPEPESSQESDDRLQESAAPGSEEGEDVPAFLRPRDFEHAVPVEKAAPPRATGAMITRIERVAVEEKRSGITVTVGASDGTEITETASSTEGGVELAVVKAAAKLADPTAPDPTVVEIEDRRVEGVDIVLIVLDVDGELATGSAIVVAGRVFALGRATWAALAL
ncbi:MAG: hypothetical protein BMS9Abin12_0558 [Acidimicrobiia bacterium]|nr:MAG: hypothetical protein BMS9Abin12_0558 [Acidimicrobiia bacterium]